MFTVHSSPFTSVTKSILKLIKTARFLDLGRLSYIETSAIQHQILEQVIAGTQPNTLIFVEHDPVLTLGASFHKENLLLTQDEYENLGIEVTTTERGGDVTYHGPNQLVIYPIFDVSQFGKDLHKWMRDLEETIIRTVDHFDLKGYRAPEINTGVWVNGKKVAAIGIKIRKWVSMHGIALNCSNDLRPFEYIVPCGVATHGVTSISQELGRKVDPKEVKPLVKQAFIDVFGLTF